VGGATAAWTALALAAALVAGCIQHAAPPPQVTTLASLTSEPAFPPAPPPAPPQKRSESGNLTVSVSADAAVCPDYEVLVGREDDHVTLERRPDDVSLDIRLDWAPVNPTATHLRARIVDDWRYPGGPSHADMWGATPLELQLFQRDLARLNGTEYLQVAADGCAPEDLVAFHSVPSDEPQRVAYRLDWNTLSDQ